MGYSSQYPNVPEWTYKDTGYHTGDMVKYQDNIFQAAYWAGQAPGVDPGWSLYDELYDLTSPTPATTAKIIGYLPTWRMDLDFGNAVMYQNITHGIIAFLNFDQNNLGELDQTSANAVAAIVPQVVTAAHQAGTYISVALGGAVDYGFLNLMTAVGGNASDPRLDMAVQNVTQFVINNGLDGVDLDLECWWDPNGDPSKDQGGRDKSNGPHPAGSALVVFAQKLKAALPGKLVSATLFATSWYGNNYDPTLADHVDWLAIMSYDLTGSWNQSPVGPHTALNKIREQDRYAAEQQGPWPATARGPTGNSTPMEDNPIFSVEDSLWYWSNPFFVNWQGAGQKVARSKLVAGVPLYGYDFAYSKGPDPQSGQIPPGYEVMRYKDVVQQFPGASAAANANIKVPGNTPRPSFVSAPGTYPYAHNIYFESPDTAVAKLKFLEMLGLGGVIIWEMSNEVWEDGVSVVEALYNASGNPATRPQLPGGVIGKVPPPPGVTGPDVLWSTDSQVPTAADAYGITGTPALAELNGTLYLVHRGGGNDPGHLWWATSDGYAWANEQTLVTTAGGPVGAYGAPALAAFNNNLYCVHPGGGNDPGHLWWTVFNGTSWTPDQQLTTTAGGPVGTSGGAGLAVLNGILYCVHPGAGNDGHLWYTSFDGNSWAPDQKITTRYGLNLISLSSPAAAVFQDLLYCVYIDGSSGGSTDMVSAVFDGQVWDVGPATGAKINSTESPALIVYQDLLWCIHGDGTGFQGYLGGATFDGAQWSDDAQIMTGLQHNGVVGTSAAPGLAVFNDTMHCVHPGGGGPSTSMWETTTPPAQLQGGWIEATGDNGYVYLQLDNLVAGQGQTIDTSQTLTVQAGVPSLVASITTDPEKADFPSGASVTIQGPDGSVYNQTSGTDTQLVLTVGSSPQLLVLNNPSPGNYQITISVPAGVEFFFQAATMPSADLIDSIDGAMDQLAARARTDRQLARRLGVPEKVSLDAITVGSVLVKAWHVYLNVRWLFYPWVAANPTTVVVIVAAVAFIVFLAIIVELGKKNKGKPPTLPPNPQPQVPSADPTCNLGQGSGGLANWFEAIGLQLNQPQTDIAEITNLIANGGFVGEIITGNNINNRQTYTSPADFFTAFFALRVFTTQWPADQPGRVVYRITFNDPVANQTTQSPWIRVGTNLYLQAFNHFTWGLTDSRWQAIPANQINYPEGGLANPAINIIAIQSAFRNADGWAQNGGTLADSAVVLNAFFAEGARFEVVEQTLAAVLNDEAEANPFNWNDFLILLQNWATITNRDLNRVSLTDSWNYTTQQLTALRAMPSLNQAQQREALNWYQAQQFHLRIDENLPGAIEEYPTTWSNWNTPPQLAVLAANRDLAAK